MVRLILAALLLIFLGALLRLAWLRLTGKHWLLLVLGTVTGMLLLVTVASGHLHWLFAIPAALLPLLGRLARFGTFLRLLWRGLSSLSNSGSSGSRSSRIETAQLRITLDHLSGKLDGVILTGPQAGARLSVLDPSTLSTLLAQWRTSAPDSAHLLEIYLDQIYGDRRRTRSGSEDTAPPPPDVELSRSDALAILGLGDRPDRAEIVQAHRRLIQRFHPDQGGSNYLAALINRAKTQLLAELKP